LSNYLWTLHWHAFTNALHKRVIWNLPRANACEAASNTRLKQLLAVEKNIYAQEKIVKSLHDRFYLSKKISECLLIHITLETAPNEMQCDETISHMVTAGQSYFRTLRNACVTAGKTTMTAGTKYPGCFEMLSWPHCTSANIINICFWLLLWFTTNGMCAKNKNTCMWRKQAIIEWSRWVISIVACCHGAKLCAHAARDFRSQQGQVSQRWTANNKEAITNCRQNFRFYGDTTNDFVLSLMQHALPLIVWDSSKPMRLKCLLCVCVRV